MDSVVVRRPDVDLSTWRSALNRRIRDAVGLTQDPPPSCDDPATAYLPVGGVARLVHGDLATMIIGGLGSLFLQMLHPHAMAGVAQHSRYRDDPLGRLLQTANFIGHTTYGSTSQALLDIERVKSVHEAVRGVADDATPYEANDPHLLAWVHACEISMFLAAYRRYGRIALSADELDTYVEEMSRLARDLGAEDPPTTLAALHDQIEAFRPELRLSEDGRVARDFLVDGFVTGAPARVAHRVFVRASFGLMTPWSREALGVATSRTRIVDVASRVLCAAIRSVVPPTERTRAQ